MPYQKYQKSLTQLREIGNSVRRFWCARNQFEIDIERLIEKGYEIKIDTVPLKAEKGVQGCPAIGGGKIFIDIGLADNDSRERYYRFTLAEELSHIILHKDIYRNVRTVDDYLKIYDQIPDDAFYKLDKNAKELAGIILMPEKKFAKRMIEVRNALYVAQGIKEPGIEQKSFLTHQIERQLMNDFNVSETPCKIRMDRIQMWLRKSLFEI
ncbi:MAG: ImmA/IrrE family metallo-endopeptidase [Elusimicrobia bacterium]|nr:ImmA/IrrE family metallo-endopeptidase [Elusimicrobiota bacterium]